MKSAPLSLSLLVLLFAAFFTYNANAACLAGTQVVGADCLACADGFWSGTTGSAFCFPCGVGNYSVTNGTICAPCPDGTIAATAGSSVCTACAAGSFFARSPGDLSGGFACASCSAGSFAPSARSTACTVCPVGTFMGAPAATVCTRCAINTFANTTNSTSCFAVQTSSGFIGNAKDGATAQVLCGVGRFPGADANGNPSCLLCPVGTFNNVTTGVSACTNCEAGSAASVTGSTNCVTCAKGTAQPAAGQSSCTVCAAGKDTQDRTGSFACYDCPAGAWTPVVGTGKCIVAPDGFQPNAADTAIEPCPAGYVSLGGHACTPCVAGFFAPQGSSECKRCPAGMFSAAASGDCTKCPPNSFNGQMGQATCTACPAGTTTFTLVGAEACPSILGYVTLPGTVSAYDIGTNMIILFAVTGFLAVLFILLFWMMLHKHDYEFLRPT